MMILAKFVFWFCLWVLIAIATYVFCVPSDLPESKKTTAVVASFIQSVLICGILWSLFIFYTQAHL